MATPANAVVTHRVTQQQLHDAGLTLQQYQDLLDDINNRHNPEVSSTDENLVTDNMPDPDPNLIASLAGLRALAITLPKFDGNSLITDWLEDFDRYSDETAGTTDANKLFDLISHLGPEVKQWFHLLPNDTKTSYVNLPPALKDRYTPTSQEILEAKGTIYAMKQGASQTFKDFVKQVQLKARQIDMSDDEVKGICINGARPHLKAHLAMAKPANMDALLKLPVVVSELSTEEPILQMFQVLNDKFDSLETTRRENRGAKQVTFDDRRSTSRSPSRQGRNRRDNSPGPQRSWDRTAPPALRHQRRGNRHRRTADTGHNHGNRATDHRDINSPRSSGHKTSTATPDITMVKEHHSNAAVSVGEGVWEIKCAQHINNNATIVGNWGILSTCVSVQCTNVNTMGDNRVRGLSSHRLTSLKDRAGNPSRLHHSLSIMVISPENWKINLKHNWLRTT